MKKAWPKIRKVINHGKTAYLADARIDGKGERKFFPTKGEAEGWAQLQRIRRQNEGQAAFSDAELAEFGLTVADAIKFTLEHYRKQKSSVTVAEATSKLAEAKRMAGRTEHYATDLEMRLGRVASAFPETPMAAITTADLEQFILGLPLAPATKNTFRRDICTLWSFAEKRNWADAKTAKDTEITTEDTKEPEVIKPDDVAKILSVCNDDLLAFHAIGFFAGLRVAEIKKLDWSDIDFEDGEIEVSARISKTRSKRIVPILDNLRAWLEPIAKTSGLVVGANLRRRYEAARRFVGYGTPGTETQKELEKNVKLIAWPDNAMRHSFVSYRLAATDNETKTAMESGHSTAILFKHYRKLVKPKDAKRYFSIEPSEPGNVVAFLKSA